MAEIMMDERVATSAPHSDEVQRVRFEFSGQGGEYFRIWIVNLFLSIITLGIYSAWAKVRREQYFHRHTSLADSAFDYHADPVNILKGRALVVAVLIAQQVLGGLNVYVAGAFSIVFLAAWPWIIRQAMRFRTANTSWRGVRFGFSGTYGQLAKILYGYGFLVLLSLGFAFPWWIKKFQVYVVNNLRFGGEHFEADPPTWDYFKPYLVMIGIVALGGVAMAVLSGGLTAAFGRGNVNQAVFMGMAVVFAFYGFMYFFGASYLRARLSNTLWNHTNIGPHRFFSDMRATRLFGLVLTNTVLIVLTLGLFMPFAKVRMARYRANTMALDVDGDLDSFVAHSEAQARALGDEAAEWLDVDVGI